LGMQEGVQVQVPGYVRGVQIRGLENGSGLVTYLFFN
jgi:hypothetical protein